MLGQLIVFGVVILIAGTILYEIYHLVKIAREENISDEDKALKVRKNLHGFTMIFFKNVRKALDAKQYGKTKINPKDLLLISTLDQAINNLSQADPVLVEKKKVLEKIKAAVTALEEAMANAEKHKSLQAKNFVLECYQELQLISDGLGQQEVFSQVKERIEAIREQAQLIAEAAIFDDDGSDTETSDTGTANLPKKTLYEVLTVERTVTQEEIKKAYRGLVNQYHPDKYEHLAKDLQAQAAERFKEINEAYSVLSDPEKRKEYEQTLG